MSDNFGNWLRTERESRSLSRFGLGWKTGIGFRMIGRLEDGKSLPDTRVIRPIAKIFGVSADDVAAMAGIPSPITNDDLVEILGDDGRLLEDLPAKDLNDLRDIADKMVRENWENNRRKNE